MFGNGVWFREENKHREWPAQNKYSFGHSITYQFLIKRKSFSCKKNPALRKVRFVSPFKWDLLEGGMGWL